MKSRTKTAKSQDSTVHENMSRLEAQYVEKFRPALKESLGLANIMEVPRLEKIVLNIGVKEAVADSRILNTVMQTFDNIAGQKSVRTLAKKSIAGFKIREGMPIGVRVTLRKRKMYDFLDKLINLALPKVRDFQGVPTKLDGRGNYNLGIKEWSIFPEADTTQEKVFGLNITIHTSAGKDAHAFELLKSFGMPFRRK
jgi:large subunit ribosomal protein L5